MKKLIFVLILITMSGCISQSELDTALADISDLETQIAEKDLTYEEMESQVNALTESANILQANYDELNDDYETLDDAKDALQKEYNAAQNDLGKLICSKQIDDMVYKNIFDVSTILAGWWVKQPNVQSVQGTYRDHIWNNTDTKIHSIMFTSSDDNQQYVEHFLVFFEEFGWNEGIFWIAEQCWLDSPY